MFAKWKAKRAADAAELKKAFEMINRDLPPFFDRMALADTDEQRAAIQIEYEKVVETIFPNTPRETIISNARYLQPGPDELWRRRVDLRLKQIEHNTEDLVARERRKSWDEIADRAMNKP